MLSTRARGPLTAYGPPGTRAMVSHLCHAYRPDEENRVHGLEARNPAWYDFRVHEVTLGPVYADEAVQIACFPAKHGDWPCVGYVIHEVYSATGLGRPHRHHSHVHTSSVELGAITAELNPRTRVLYHQLYFGGTDADILADVRAQYAGEVVSAADLDTVRLPRKNR